MKTINLTTAITLFAIVLFAGLLFQSCNKQNPPTQSELEGYWVLKTINGKDAKSLFSGAQPTLQFNFIDNIISGTGGCNQYNGTFSYKEGKFSAPNLAVTRMLCTEENDEGQFLLELSNVNNSLSIVNGILAVSHDNKVVLEFEKGQAPAETSSFAINTNKLAGDWKLKIIDGIAATTKYTGGDSQIPTISFNFTDNKVSGNSGCNAYNATFSLHNDLLVLGPIISTRMACPNLEGEAQFAQAIADSSNIAMPDDNVLLFAKKGQVLLEFEKYTAKVDSTSTAK